MNRARRVHVVNSRLPVYKLTYGDGFGDVVTGLFTRIAPKILPIGKELASKAIGVVGKSAATEAVIRAFNAAKETIASLMREKKTRINLITPRLNCRQRRICQRGLLAKSTKWQQKN